MVVTEIFNKHAVDYDSWYDRNNLVFESEILAIREHLDKLPAISYGIEVGLGTGRFASALGIKEGIEPAEAMRQMAVKRGIEVMNAKAEHLPYKDLHFDFVIMVMLIGYLESPLVAFREANRVLKLGGRLIVAFIDKDSEIATLYAEKKPPNIFYKNCNFRSITQVQKWLEEAHFKAPEFTQTLFKQIDEINEVEPVKAGFGEGSFVVVSAEKK